MNLVAQTVAKSYSPATQQAQAAATEFVSAAKAWGERFKTAQDNLQEFVRANVGEARGFVSRDQLNMSVFGLVFDKAPAAGFLAVPGAVADDLRDQGLRGNAYFPDTTHPLGKKVMALMNQVSRIAEQRPLLNAVKGVAPAAVEGGRVVLSRALVGANGEVVVKAAAAALKPGAEVTPVAVAPAAREVATTEARATRTMRM
jgi:hypothetical protein